MKVLVKCVLAVLAVGAPTAFAQVSIPNTFVEGELATAAEMNDNFASVVSGLNDVITRLDDLEEAFATSSASLESLSGRVDSADLRLGDLEDVTELFADPSGTYVFAGVVTATDQTENSFGGGSFSGNGTVGVSADGSCSGSMSITGYTGGVWDGPGGVAIGSEDGGGGGGSGSVDFTCEATSVGGTFVAQVIFSDGSGQARGLVVGVRVRVRVE